MNGDRVTDHLRHDCRPPRPSLDHLLATPFFDPERCSIGFHPLHSELAITIYVLGMIFAKNKVLRLVFIGLFFHMLTDLLDCLWTYARCAPCMQDIF